MSHKTLQQAINLIQSGNLDAGGRMLRNAIKDPELPNNFRATAYLWLAETNDDLNFKIDCLNNALRYDPQNPSIQQRLNQMMSQQLNQPPQPSQPKPPPSSLPNLSSNQPPNPDLEDSQPIKIVPPDFSDSRPMPPVNPPPAQPRPPIQFQQHDTGDSRPMPPTNQPTAPQQPPNQYPTYDTNPPNISNPQPTRPTNLPPTSNLSTPSRYRIPKPPRVVGVRQGPNGMGTGVFVSNSGIVATTRSVVGGNETMQVEIDSGQEMPAQVVRTFPEFDIALLQVNVTLDSIWTAIQVPVIPDNQTLMMVSYNGSTLQGVKRKSKHITDSYWIPTNIELSRAPDAGGDGIFDTNWHLAGLLTLNASRETGYVYGVHIFQVYQCVQQYMHELQQVPNAGYCTGCGNITQAQHYGGFYCETCGTILPGLESARRFYQPSLSALYGDNMHRACPNCTARVGYHDGFCLRCGQDVSEGHLV